MADWRRAPFPSRGPRRIRLRKPWPLGTLGVPAVPAVPSGGNQPLYYPHLVQHKRSARNGHIPEAGYLRALVNAQDHVMAYRRKTFFTIGDHVSTITGTSGSTVKYRFRCHAGYGAQNLVFLLTFGKVTFNDPAPSNPRATVDVTNVATGVVTSASASSGVSYTGTNTIDYPYELTERILKVPVTANTTYEVAISVVDFARLIEVAAYEEGTPHIDLTIDYFTNPSAAGVGYPVYDATRQRMVQGLSEIWKRNGAQLLTLPSLGGATFTSTTFTNLLDDTSTAADSTTPGFQLGHSDFTMNPCATWRGVGSTSCQCVVVFAVHGSCTTLGNGAVKLIAPTGASLTHTTVGTTAGWYASLVTLGSLTTTFNYNLHARVTSGGDTLTLNAISIYMYVP